MPPVSHAHCRGGGNGEQQVMKQQQTVVLQRKDGNAIQVFGVDLTIRKSAK